MCDKNGNEIIKKITEDELMERIDNIFDPGYIPEYEKRYLEEELFDSNSEV